MSVGDWGTDVGGPTRRLGGWQLNSVAADMTLQKESPVLFVTAGWYRGFILKNPNTKVRDVLGCAHVYSNVYVSLYIERVRYIRLQSMNIRVVRAVRSMGMMDGLTPVSEVLQFTR